jgi:hypothetical protein
MATKTYKKQRQVKEARNNSDLAGNGVARSMKEVICKHSLLFDCCGAHRNGDDNSNSNNNNSEAQSGKRALRRE